MSKHLKIETSRTSHTIELDDVDFNRIKADDNVKLCVTGIKNGVISVGVLDKDANTKISLSKYLFTSLNNSRLDRIEPMLVLDYNLNNNVHNFKMNNFKNVKRNKVDKKLVDITQYSFIINTIVGQIEKTAAEHQMDPRDLLGDIQESLTCAKQLKDIEELVKNSIISKAQMIKLVDNIYTKI